MPFDCYFMLSPSLCRGRLLGLRRWAQRPLTLIATILSARVDAHAAFAIAMSLMRCVIRLRPRRCRCMLFMRERAAFRPDDYLITDIAAADKRPAELCCEHWRALRFFTPPASALY